MSSFSIPFLGAGDLLELAELLELEGLVQPGGACIVLAKWYSDTLTSAPALPW